MSFWKQSELNNNHNGETQQAEMLDAYTRWIKGEKLSLRQKRLLKAFQESAELEPLRKLVDFAHYQFQESDSFEPRPGAKERIADEVIRSVGRQAAESDSWATDNLGLQPAYSAEQVGSESELVYSPSPDVAPILPEVGDPFSEPIVVEPEGNDENQSPSLVEGNCHLKLKVVHGDQAGSEYNIVFLQMIIGRGTDATVQLQKNAGASRKHALLSIENDELYITDLNSGNGTFVDGRRISEPTPLYIASQVTIGEQSLEVNELRREEGAFRVTFKEIAGADVGQFYSVSVREMTIGRGKTARLRLSDSTGTLSRLHVQFELTNGQIYLRDLGSTNGTYVDGNRIGEPKLVNIGSVIKFGGIICEVTEIERS